MSLFDLTGLFGFLIKLRSIRSSFFRIPTLLAGVILLVGCVGTQTKLVRAEASGSWETFATDSGVPGNPGKMINSKTFGTGNTKYEKYSTPYLNVRENPDGKVDIIYFPGFQSPSQPSVKPNQQVDVYAKFPLDLTDYVYNFTADSVTGDLLFFTGNDMHAFLEKMERESFVIFNHLDKVKRKYLTNKFSLNGSPHVVVRLK